MPRQVIDPQGRLRSIAILTWGIVAIAPLLGEHLDRAHTIAWICALGAFLAMFLLAAHPGCSRAVCLYLTAGQGIAALVAARTSTTGFEAVLLVIVAAQLGSLPFRLGVVWVVIQSVLLASLFTPFSQKVLLMTLAHFAFQLFALFTVHTAHSERLARQELAAVNAELKVASGLLDINSRTSERLRIARDLHDLLGHHLTALTLNLEIASHVANDDAKASIETSRSIAKRLLADVRDVVSRLRDDEPVDLTAALAALQSVITVPALHLDVAPDVVVHDSSVAQVALRAVEEIVTNAVRHSGARNLWITLNASDGTLAIAARDDGDGVDYVRFGNGLHGMRERVTAAQGEMEVSSMRGRGFHVNVRLPLVPREGSE